MMNNASLKWHWKAAALSLCLTNITALAFAPRIAITHQNQHGGQHADRLLRPMSSLKAEKNNASSMTKEAFPGIDDRTRRRLVFSLLASSSVLPTSAWAATKPSSIKDPSSSTTTTDETSERVVRPPLDNRAYFSYTLPNGLKVLLCSDPASTTAAVGMNVHVGACSDPVEIPGLVSSQR
jgi:hypothetical protein